MPFRKKVHEGGRFVTGPSTRGNLSTGETRELVLENVGFGLNP